MMCLCVYSLFGDYYHSACVAVCFVTATQGCFAAQVQCSSIPCRVVDGPLRRRPLLSPFTAVIAPSPGGQEAKQSSNRRRRQCQRPEWGVHR